MVNISLGSRSLWIGCGGVAGRNEANIGGRAKNKFVPRRAGTPELLERFSTQGSQAGSRERIVLPLGLLRVAGLQGADRSHSLGLSIDQLLPDSNRDLTIRAHYELYITKVRFGGPGKDIAKPLGILMGTAVKRWENTWVSHS